MSVTVFFDCETGGVLDSQPTIQLAAIAVNDSDGRELSAFQCKIQFKESDCDPEALKLNHYTAEAWKDAIDPGAIAANFSRFLEPYRSMQMVSKRTGAPYSVAKLAGYNALTFDMPRLRRLYGQKFTPFGFHVRDVLQRMMFWLDENEPQEKPENLKLGTVCRYFGMDISGAHDALTDVRLCAALARRLRQSEVR